jgi:two-component system sensor histidine kinase RegB
MLASPNITPGLRRQTGSGPSPWFETSSTIPMARWTFERVWLEIRDDGPGFSSEVLLRAGEPYVTTRSPDRSRKPDSTGAGLGLGLFIAKTLIERSGAQLTLSNASQSEATGAVVRIGWARHIFERDALALHHAQLSRGQPLTETGATPI